MIYMMVYDIVHGQNTVVGIAAGDDILHLLLMAIFTLGFMMLMES